MTLTSIKVMCPRNFILLAFSESEIFTGLAYPQHNLFLLWFNLEIGASVTDTIHLVTYHCILVSGYETGLC